MKVPTIMNKFILCYYEELDKDVLVNIDNISYIINENNKPKIVCSDGAILSPKDTNIEFIHFIGNFSIDLVSGR